MRWNKKGIQISSPHCRKKGVESKAPSEKVCHSHLKNFQLQTQKLPQIRPFPGWRLTALGSAFYDFHWRSVQGCGLHRNWERQKGLPSSKSFSSLKQWILKVKILPNILKNATKMVGIAEKWMKQDWKLFSLWALQELTFRCILAAYWLHFDWILAAFWLHFDCILAAFWLYFDCILAAF